MTNMTMDTNKRTQINKSIARQILLALKSENCFDGFITRFYTKTKCINYLQKEINEYFHKRSQLVNWNKNSWLDIFDDNYLVEAIVWYMQDFNLAKEIEEEEEINNTKKKNIKRI